MIRKALFLTMCALVILCPGCWDVRVVEDLALAFSLGIDIVPENDELISITMTNPTFSPDAEATTAKVTVQGYNLANVFVNAQRQRDRVLVLGQVSTMVFSEEIARNGKMNELLKDVDQQRDMNPNTMVVVVRGAPARDVLQLEPPEETRVAVYLARLLERNFEFGLVPEITAADFWFRSDIGGIDPIVPVIEITGHEDEKKGILIVGLAAFDSRGKMVGIIPDSEIIHFLFLTRQPRRSRFSTKVDVGSQMQRPVTIYVKNVRKNVQSQIVDDRAEIKVKMEVDLDIIDIEASLDSLDEEIHRELEQKLARDIQGNALAMLRRTQNWQSDPIGLGRCVRVANPQWFRNKNWGEEYEKALIDMEVKVSIKRIGTLVNPE